MQDVVTDKGAFIDSTINNNPKNIPLDATLSLRTKNFVKRFKLLNHISQENAFSDSGFSATLFKDTKADSKDSEYISQLRFS